MRWLSVVFPFLFACTAVTSSDPVELRVLGTIDGYRTGDPHIEIQGGTESALVKITTYGGGCHRKGETEVEIEGMVAEVAPYDYVLVGENIACIDILVILDHEVTVHFDGNGEAQVTVIGLDLHGDTVRVQRLVNVD
jgi:hypothetical protein